MKVTAFTLIEILITLAIIAILVCICYPLYSSQIQRVYRARALISLHTLESHLENYYEDNNTYKGTTLQSLGIDNNNPRYTLKITGQTDSTYKMSIMPKTPEDSCGILTLDQTGRKIITDEKNGAACWR